ncbi:MAG TPA: DNA polymerase, partial [Armatimonadota bacterium]|nr:DNA polymerase [Armatimonadota bacterium]
MNDHGNSRRHKLIAIDGNSLLYRAFFAMKHLSTISGQPTNAVYGFTTMLLRLVQEEKPDSIVVAFDAPAKTFRHNEFVDYKAHRKPAPDELRSQAPIARQVVEAFNIPMIEVPGYEADDVVGTIAKMACERDYDTLIVTGDLDALQLVNDCVKVMTTVKGVSDTVIYDAQAVEDRFGIRPENMADFKALKGDPSDNIPGVSGVGDKKAASLVRQFGNIETLIENIDEVSDLKLKAVLADSKDQLVLSKRLASIVTDVPINYSLEDMKLKEPDYDRLRNLFRELEFRTLLKRLPEPENEEEREEDRPRAVLGVCSTVETREEFRELMDRLKSAGKFALRTHTTSGKPTESDLLGVSFSLGPGETAYVRVSNVENLSGGATGSLFDAEDSLFSVNVSEFKELFEDANILKYGHDLKLDYEALKLRGVKLCGLNFDTMVGAYVLNSARSGYSISDVAWEQLGLELPQIDKKAKDQDSQPSPQFITCAEAEAVWRLVPVLSEKLKQDGLLELMNRVEMPLIPVLADIELTGVSIDTGYFGALSHRLNDRIRELEQEIYQLAGHEFNIGSPKQLQTVLFEERQLPVGKKTKTGYSTDAGTLEALAPAYPIVAKILEWREL